MKKSLSPSLLRLCGVLLLAMAGSACSGVGGTTAVAAAPTPPPGAAPGNATDMLAQLRAEIGTAACDSAQQCKTIAVGHKACGGPETYLAWSTKGSDAAKVRSLADAYGAKRKSDNLASGMMSTCMAIMDPGATCSAGRCVTGGGTGAI
jgi:hypothetical protein